MFCIRFVYDFFVRVQNKQKQIQKKKKQKEKQQKQKEIQREPSENSKRIANS